MPIAPEAVRRTPTAPTSGIVMFQTSILVIAILYVAREVLVPTALAVLLGFVLAPITTVLRRAGLPRPVSVLIAVAAAVAAIGAIGTMLGSQLGQLAENLPTYQAAIERKFAGLAELSKLFGRFQGMLAKVAETAPGLPSPGTPAITTVAIQPAALTPLEALGQVAGVLLHPLATAGIVVILAIFVLLYREDLRDRLIRIAGAHDLHRTMAAMDDAAFRLSRYFLSQVALNAAYGVAITGVLWMLGIPNPLLWGFLTGLLRFVPFIGTWIAVGFPALLAMAVDPGWGLLIWVVAIYAIGEAIMGQVFEPWIFGHSTGLSPIAVMVAAVFWTWLWGPIGLILAVPLTACIVVLGRHVDALAFLEVALGNRPPLEAEETFYQRALAGDANALGEQADRCLKDQALAAYLDDVALPALRFAQEDARRGTLSPERAQQLEATVATLLDDLGDADDEAPQEVPPPEWQEVGAVLCVPGRGRFDASAAAMLARVLAERGFGAQIGVEPATGTAPLLACLCVLEGGGSTTSARSALRRVRRRLPAVPVVVFAGGDGGERPIAAALLAEKVPPPLAASLSEARGLVSTTAGADAAKAAPRDVVPEPV